MEKIIRKKINWSVLFVLIIYELFLVAFVFIWSYATIVTIFGGRNYFEFLFTSIILILLGIFVFDLILWQIKGYEVIIVKDETIIIKKKGKIFGSKNVISFSEIDSIEIKEYKTKGYNIFIKAVGIKGGKICINYLDKAVFIGQGLNNLEASKYSEEMKNLVFNGNLSDYKS